ncbi:MAG: glycosyltransferase family 4 protein [Chloroflexi bacterium]|nr:glycosyltransferase family 4 protein [Chloroflexota bacterium]MCL5026588.1 glycosyltransferase family 4 protein [Chloroflexota bacterium]
MKIALVTPYDYPYPGGVTQHILHLDEEFRRLGHEVKIIAPSSGDKEELAKERIIKVGSVFPIPANGSVARVTLSLRLSGRIKQILEHEKFDVVHLHEPLLPGLPATVLRHSQSINIGTFHSYWSGYRLAYFSAKPILRRFANRLHGRIAVSAAALSTVSNRFPGNYVIIPNGINLQAFSGALPPLEGLRDDKLNILFVGRLEKRKGFRYLVRAFARLKAEMSNIRLIVAGAYDEKTKRRYQNLTAEARLSDVLFLGHLSLEDLARCYASCDIFCAPSTGGESFGIVLLEAMASGKPIVASDIDGYRGLVTFGQEGILVPPKDDLALATALRRLLSDEPLRKALGDRGVAKAQDYAWPKVARRVLDYYGKVREQSGAAGFPGLRRNQPPDSFGSPLAAGGPVEL